jgi:hypothetical protein
MSGSAFRLLRIFGLLSAASLGLGALPAFAQSEAPPGDCATIDFRLGNPEPFARVESGTMVVAGVALDSSASDGSVGVQHVDFFIEDRDQGGTLIGTATPGVSPEPYGLGSFQTTLTIPKLLTGGHMLFAYALDTVTGEESIISQPIAVGVDANKAFARMLPPPDTAQICVPPPPSEPAPADTGEMAAPPPEMAQPMVSTIALSVGNPSPGDTIKGGNLVIEGSAFDSAADSGTGIDAVNIFLGERDAGGMMLGSADDPGASIWSAQVKLPTKQTGIHTLWFYAHSAVTGEETAVSIPVMIAR